MRRIVTTAALAAAILLSAGAAHAGEGKPQQILAMVNGAGITRDEFERTWRIFLERSGIPAEAAEGASEAGDLRTQVLDTLVDRELLSQEAARAKVAATDERVAEAVAEARGQFSSDEDFTKALAENGLTEAGLKELFRRELAIQSFIERDVAPGATVSDAEVHEFYAANRERFEQPEQVRARHILVKLEEGADEPAKAAARAKAESLLARIKGGADFAATAKEGSDCPSAAQGGDLGTFTRGQMVEPFDAAVFALKPGELSGVVESPFGFHVIRLEERTPPGTVAEAEVAGRIREHLQGEKTGQAVDARLKTLREKAKIEVLAKP